MIAATGAGVGSDEAPPRALTRLASAIIAGSFSRSCASTGGAIKIDEYVPTIKPMNSASEISLRVPAPSHPAQTNRIEETGSSATIDVFVERTIV